MRGNASRSVVCLVLLPKTFGSEAVEPEIYHAVAQELALRFGHGAAILENPAFGMWEDLGDLLEDDTVMIEVDLEDTPTNRQILRTYAQGTLLDRFRGRSVRILFVNPAYELRVDIEDFKA